MVKRFITFIILLSLTISAFSLSLNEIYLLSKAPETLDKSWDELLNYINKNPYDADLALIGEKIGVKRYFYKKYPSFAFVKSIISEDLQDFATNLTNSGFGFKFEKKDTEILLKLFKNIPIEITDAINNGDTTKSYIKSFYRLDGIKEYINPKTFDVYLKNLMTETVTNPAFLDTEQKEFIKTFVPKTVLSNLNTIIKNSTISLNEKDFIAGYQILSFLKGMNLLDSDKVLTFASLDAYFNTKTKLTSLTNSVYFVSKQETEIFAEQFYSILKDVKNISISRQLLEDLSLNIAKALNSKIEKTSENMFSKTHDFSKIDDHFNSKLNNELVRLDSLIAKKQLSPQEQEKLKIKNESNTKEPNTQPSESATQTTKKSSSSPLGTLLLFLILILTLSLIIFIRENPTPKVVEILTKSGLLKEALRACEKLIIKEPTNSKSYILLADIYEKMGDEEKRIIAYKSAMKHGQNIYKDTLNQKDDEK